MRQFQEKRNYWKGKKSLSKIFPKTSDWTLIGPQTTIAWKGSTIWITKLPLRKAIIIQTIWINHLTLRQ
jgi:hypothetical protein